MCNFTKLLNHIESRKIKIVNMAMGSNNISDWECFIEKAKDLNALFIISAGNNGMNIDKHKVYPASFNSDNFLVVTSSDIYGNLASDSNYGRQNVDIMLPGEQIAVIDHRGVKTIASGSSYAVPRLSAMAVRFLTNYPNATIDEIKEVLISRTINPSDVHVKFGWIPDPLDDYLLN